MPPADSKSEHALHGDCQSGTDKGAEDAHLEAVIESLLPENPLLRLEVETDGQQVNLSFPH